MWQVHAEQQPCVLSPLHSSASVSPFASVHLSSWSWDLCGPTAKCKADPAARLLLTREGRRAGGWWQQVPHTWRLSSDPCRPVCHHQGGESSDMAGVRTRRARADDSHPPAGWVGSVWLRSLLLLVGCPGQTMMVTHGRRGLWLHSGEGGAGAGHEPAGGLFEAGLPAWPAKDRTRPSRMQRVLLVVWCWGSNLGPTHARRVRYQRATPHLTPKV